MVIAELQIVYHRLCNGGNQNISAESNKYYCYQDM